jgi:hypothetical protein
MRCRPCRCMSPHRSGRAKSMLKHALSPFGQLRPRLSAFDCTVVRGEQIATKLRRWRGPIRRAPAQLSRPCSSKSPPDTHSIRRPGRVRCPSEGANGIAETTSEMIHAALYVCIDTSADRHHSEEARYADGWKRRPSREQPRKLRIDQSAPDSAPPKIPYRRLAWGSRRLFESRSFDARYSVFFRFCTTTSAKACLKTPWNERDCETSRPVYIAVEIRHFHVISIERVRRITPVRSGVRAPHRPLSTDRCRISVYRCYPPP